MATERLLPLSKIVITAVRLNPNHHRRRNRITLTEEVVHIHWRHKPSGLRDVMPGLRVCEYHKGLETEAFGVGAAVLLRWGQFYHKLNAGTPIEELAELSMSPRRWCKRKRPVFPSGVGLVVRLTIVSWYRRKEQNVALADFGRLPRSGRLSI
jgi:hypothetical protein